MLVLILVCERLGGWASGMLDGGRGMRFVAVIVRVYGRGLEEAVCYEVGGVQGEDVWRLLGDDFEAVDGVVEDGHQGGSCGALGIFRAPGEIIY